MSRLQPGNDGVDVVDASAPDSSAGLHQGGPQPGVVGKRGMRPEIRAGSSRGQPARTFFRAERLLRIAHQVDGAGQLLPVDDNLNLVAVEELADGASGK